MSTSAKRVAGKLFGGALLAGMLGLGASSASASLMLDLRVIGGADAKAVTNLKAGDVINLGVYAVVNGADADTTNDGFSIAYFSALAATGKVQGNLATAELPIAFQGNGFTTGKVQDLNGDGFMDVGTNTTSATTDFIYARALETQKGNDILIATLKYTVGNILTAGADTTINVASRARSAIPQAVWMEDGVDGKKWTGAAGLVPTGAPVTLSGATVNPSTYSVSFGAAAGETKATVKVKGGLGYLSEVQAVGAAAGSVKIEAIGAGPTDAGVIAMLWLAGDSSKFAEVKAGLENVSFIENNDPALAGMLSYYGSLAGEMPTLTVKFDAATMGSDNFFNFNFGDSGVTLGKIAVVPEPASLTLLGLGAAALLGRRRRHA